MISDPGNHFELGLGRPDYLLVAGGIGLTPIYTMAMALADDMQRYLVEEEVEHWQEGTISRREFIRRVTLLAGGVLAWFQKYLG